MTHPCPAVPDALRPTEEQALEAWAARVRADREQVERCREIEDPADFYAPVATRFYEDPHRKDDPALDTLRSMARADDVWLDIGSGGGRYALPIALSVNQVHAIDPSPAMIEVMRGGMRDHGITNVDINEGRWPLEEGVAPTGDVALMAHVGYDIEHIGHFLDEAERSASRACVMVMRVGAGTATPSRFWRALYGEDRLPLPALPELLVLLVARGSLPTVTLTRRQPLAFETLPDLLAMARRLLWVKPDSEKDRKLQWLVEQQATRRDEGWALDWKPPRVGIASWEPRLADSPVPSRST